jgi:hypothetical protein
MFAMLRNRLAAAKARAAALEAATSASHAGFDPRERTR